MNFSAIIHIIYQTILTFPIIFGVLIALPVLAILAVTFAQRRDWRRGKKPALIFALVAGIVAFFGLPTLFHSSLANISYLTDWLFHLGCVLVAMVYVYLLVWLIFTPSRRDAVKK